MYSFSVTLRLIFAISLLSLTTVHSAELNRHLTKNINYARFPTIDVAPQILQIRNADQTFLCAGTLIAPRYVITAAECFNRIDFTKAVVVAGATSVTDNGTERHISRINKHPAKHINIAVLQLNEPLIGIEPMQLGYLNVYELEENRRVRLMGWRHLARRKSVTKELYSVKAIVSPQGECELSFYAAGTKKVFCLQGDRYDNEDEPCVSAAGGPAFFEAKLIGVVARGQRCGYNDYITSVTSVSDILPFVAEAMK